MRPPPTLSPSAVGRAGDGSVAEDWLLRRRSPQRGQPQRLLANCRRVPPFRARHGRPGLFLGARPRQASAAALGPRNARLRRHLALVAPDPLPHRCRPGDPQLQDRQATVFDDSRQSHRKVPKRGLERARYATGRRADGQIAQAAVPAVLNHSHFRRIEHEGNRPARSSFSRNAPGVA
jgi:hypothetical protein